MGKIILTFLLLSTSLVSLSQNRGSIQGKITDSEMFNEPLLMAQVSLKNSSRTAQTNFHGNFELEDIDPGKYILLIRYLGYETLEIPVQVGPDKITRIERSLSAKRIDVTSILQSETATTETTSMDASVLPK